MKSVLQSVAAPVRAGLIFAISGKRLLPAVLVVMAAAAAWICLKGAGVATAKKAGAGEKQLAASQPTAVAPTRPEELAEFQKKVRSVFERALPSVGLFLPGPKKQLLGSAVIISRDGHVVTHAHHGQAPGTLVTMVFGNSRKTTGKLLGVHRYFDLSLVKLDGAGPWPAAPLGSAAALKVGDPCVAIGYPAYHVTFYGDRHAKGQPPLLRLGRILGLHDKYVMNSCNTTGGDSGGPLFNLQGELIGTMSLSAMVAEGRLVEVSGHVSVDLFKKIREQLLEEKLFTDDTLLKLFEKSKGPFDRTKELNALATSAQRSVVTVLVGEKPVALGVAIAAGGWVVTKASALSGPVACRLADGRKLEATLNGTSDQYDFALLKVPAKDLPAAPWSEGPVPSVAMIVASVGPKAAPLSFGVVCSPVESVPPIKGVLAKGLPNVFVHDALLSSEQCGGPVVDASGKVVAINIATRVFNTRTYAVPAAVVRKVIEQLRKE